MSTTTASARTVAPVVDWTETDKALATLYAKPEALSADTLASLVEAGRMSHTLASEAGKAADDLTAAIAAMTKDRREAVQTSAIAGARTARIVHLILDRNAIKGQRAVGEALGISQSRVSHYATIGKALAASKPKPGAGDASVYATLETERNRPGGHKSFTRAAARMVEAAKIGQPLAAREAVEAEREDSATTTPKRATVTVKDVTRRLAKVADTLAGSDAARTGDAEQVAAMVAAARRVVVEVERLAREASKTE